MTFREVRRGSSSEELDRLLTTAFGDPQNATSIAFRKVLGWWSQYVKPMADNRVVNTLDLCCGAGRSAIPLVTGNQNSPNWHVHLLDGDKNMLSKAEARLGEIQKASEFSGKVTMLQLLSSELPERRAIEHANVVTAVEAFHEIRGIPFLHGGKAAGEESLRKTLDGVSAIQQPGDLFIIQDIFGCEGYVEYLPGDSPRGKVLERLVKWVSNPEEPNLIEDPWWTPDRRKRLTECILEGNPAFDGEGRIHGKLLTEAIFRVKDANGEPDLDQEVHGGLTMKRMMEELKARRYEVIGLYSIPHAELNTFFKKKADIILLEEALAYGALLAKKMETPTPDVKLR